MATEQELRSAQTHIQAIGIINLVLAGLGLVAALVILLAAGITAGASKSAGAEEEGMLASGILTLVAVFAILLALPQLFAGIGLLKRRSWGRVLAFITGALGLLNIPLGTAFGIYTFIGLTRPGVEEALSGGQ